jgi:hypothetical protein
MEAWAEIALALDWVPQWIEGAIFPAEMVFFLGSCEAAGISYVIESGRQDGYSSQILGEFARRTGVRVASIDYEDDKERGRRCRERLAAYPIDLKVGDAFELLGAMLNEGGEDRIALLVDGPKGFSALSLVAAAAADPRVAIIAMHNQDPGTGYRRAFERIASAPLFYEDAVSVIGPHWERLREAERAHCLKLSARRSLEHSTLALLPIGERERKALGRLYGPEFKLYQPPLVRLGWRLKFYRSAAMLYSLSFRLFGS